MARLEVKLSRPDRIYRPPDAVDGALVITATSSFSHQGIRITVLGSVIIQPSSRAVGVIESLYSSVKPILLLRKSLDLSAPGKIGIGRWEFPFHVSLDVPKSAPGDGTLGIYYETYHGAYINIQYQINVEVTRGYLHKPYTAILEFFVEGRKARFGRVESVNFYITQDTQSHFLLPTVRSGGFKVTGKIPTQCFISEPLIGELTVEHSVVPILSIDARLFRLETILLFERSATEKTEIQTTQIADGDVCRGMTLPIYIILPRLLTCPTLSAGSFCVEFELSITITFDMKSISTKQLLETDSKQLVASETLPLRLLRF